METGRHTEDVDRLSGLPTGSGGSVPQFSRLFPSGEENTEMSTEEDIIFTNESVELSKDIMKRLLRIHKRIGPLRENLEAQQRGLTSGTPWSEEVEHDTKEYINLLYKYGVLQLFLWERLSKILYSEYIGFVDAYVNTLSLQDRVRFESLVGAVHHNTSFCDYMGEIIDATPERHSFPPGGGAGLIRSGLSRYGRLLEKTQAVATYAGLLVVHGSRESFLDPVSVQDLSKIVIEEKKRRKRLIALSLIFSTLEQDDQAIGEALSQKLPHILLQRLRHLVHRMFGYPETSGSFFTQKNSRSPFRHYSAIIRSETDSPVSLPMASPETAGECLGGFNNIREIQLAPSPEKQTTDLSATRYVICTRLPRDRTPGEFYVDEEKGMFKRGRLEHHFDVYGETDCGPLKKPRAEVNRDCVADEFTKEQWRFQKGDKVARGPMWRFGSQDKKCDFGEVIEITTSGEVLVRWVRGIDLPYKDESSSRIFRYKYTKPNEEVVPFDYFLKTQAIVPEWINFKMEEFMLSCAVAGALCHEREAVLPALQFQAIESMVYVLSRINLAAAAAAAMRAEECAEASESTLLQNSGEATTVDGETLENRLRWNTSLQQARECHRQTRELVERVCWLLSSLLTHKKLALIFLELGGLEQIMRLTNGHLETSTTHGCCVVLSQLARCAVFESLLRSHARYFEPIMRFIFSQWRDSLNHDVQSSAGGFLFRALSFPCVITFFDTHQGPQVTVNIIERLLYMSEEGYDVMFSSVTLAALKCTYVYLISNLMLSTRVVFRKHRFLSALVTDSSPGRPLPRDAPTVESVLGYLSAPYASIPDISAETVQSFLTRDRLAAFRFLADSGFHQLLLRCVQFYFNQNRWDLLVAALNVFCVLAVVPFFRPLLADARYPESGIVHLIMIVSELTSAFQCGNASRQSYLIPCVATSLQILLNLTRPPTDKSDEGSVSTFNRICGTIRTSDGVRTLLEVLKIRGDSAMSVRLQLFPVIARALQLMVTLRRYADTRLLFDALGVNTVARDLMTHYGDVQKEYLSMMGPRYVASEVYATGRFMENIKCFLFDESSPSAPAFSVDPVELEQRQAIIARSHITYSRESLLELIYRHLEAEGLVNAAAALRHDAFLPSDVSAPQQSANVSQDLTVSSIGAPTLDSIIHSYLIQQHEKSANPITTLPQFDLRKNHVYYPLDVSVDQTRNAFDRRLTQKMGLDFSLRARTNENHLVYRYPGYLFDIAGDIDEPGGESVAFCDDGETLVVGNSDGKISLFENFPDESMGGKFLEQHVAFENDAVIGIFASGDSTLLGLVSDAHKITVMGRDELPIVRFQIEGSRAATFSCCNAYLLATCDEEHTCRLYDLGAQSVVRHFSDPSWVGENIENVATFDVFSQLVLSDAVLWDVRCGDKPIYRFDRFTDSFCNIFHPFNPLVIIDEKIWDLRTLSILRTVHAFRNSRNLQTIPLGRVIYSFRDSSSLTSFNAPVLSVVESYTFETVFSTEVRPAFRSFSIDPTDRYCAAILDDDSSTVVRVFSTSSGPLPGQQGFPLPQDSRGGGGDSGLSEDGEEDEVGSDSTWSGVYEDVDDDESEDDSNYMGHDLVAESSDDVGFSHTDEETESGTSVPTEEDSVEVREDRETLDETGSSADASVDST